MSIGAPSNLGTLLIQRLDAALGATLGQQGSLAGAAGSQAVPQPGTPDSPGMLQNDAQRHPQESIDRASPEGGRRAAVGRAMQEAQLDNLLGRAATLSTTTPSAPTTLGYAARIILALLNAYPQADQAIRGQAPLVPDPGNLPSRAAAPATQAASTESQAPSAPAARGTVQGTVPAAPGAAAPLATHLAEALDQSVRTSGLFYESHLAQLAAGRASAQDLRKEPQGQITNEAARQLQRGDAVPAERAPGLHHADAPAATPAMDTKAQLPAGPGTPAAVPGLDPQVQPLVRQQLEVLANQGFVWQGEPWPGAAMHWEVHRDRGRDPDAPAGDDTRWATRLTLHLPALGAIHARLSLAGPQLVMHITAPQAAHQLHDALELLRTSLLARGLEPAQLSVTAVEPPEVREPHAPAREAATS